MLGSNFGRCKAVICPCRQAHGVSISRFWRKGTGESTNVVSSEWGGRDFQSDQRAQVAFAIGGDLFDDLTACLSSSIFVMFLGVNVVLTMPRICAWRARSVTMNDSVVSSRGRSPPRTS